MAFGVTLKGQVIPDHNLAFLLTDSKPAEGFDSLIGKAVTQDTSAANSVKLVTSGSKVLGRILLVEDRTSQGEGVVATIERCGGMTLPYDGDAPAVGDTVVGGTAAGNVAKESETSAGLLVWEVDTTAKTVTVLL